MQRINSCSSAAKKSALTRDELRPRLQAALDAGESPSSTVVVGAKRLLLLSAFRSGQHVASAVDSEPRLFLAKQDLEPQLAEVLAAGVPRESDEVVAAQRLLELIKAEAALTPRGSKETPRRLEHVEQSTQELEALHRDASHQGIVGIAVIADLFEGANRALRKLEEHTDARETPSDGL